MVSSSSSSTPAPSSAPPQFVQNGGKLVTQMAVVDLGITLYHYVPAQEAASCDVVLLYQAGEPHSGL